jgi:hypothetical protein
MEVVRTEAVHTEAVQTEAVQTEAVQRGDAYREVRFRRVGRTGPQRSTSIAILSEVRRPADMVTRFILLVGRTADCETDSACRGQTTGASR